MVCVVYSIVLWLTGGPCVFYLLLLFCAISPKSEVDKDEYDYIVSIVFARHARYCKRKFDGRKSKPSIESYCVEFKTVKKTQ